MLFPIKNLTSKVWIGAITFAIGVAVTMVWVVPRVMTEKTPEEAPASNVPQQREIVSREGWRRLEFNNKVFIMLPSDMRSEKLIGDSLRYRESYSNKQLGLILIGDAVVPVPDTVLLKKRIFSCDRPEIVRKDPTYSESLIQVDGRHAKLAITHAAEGGISAHVCFPNADDSVAELVLIADCKNDQAFAIAREIFNSIRFKR